MTIYDSQETASMNRLISILGILKGAREILSDRKKWIKGVLARDTEGRAVVVDAASAVCFCMIGAIRKVAGGDHDSASRRMLERVLRDGDIAEYNDAPNRRHSEVLKAFDRAIAKIENAQVAS